MDKITQMGRDFTKGVLLELGKWMLITILVLGLYSTVANFFEWGVDNSDADAWNRSGLIIKTDHLTGVQYIKSGDTLCVRVGASGDPILSR